MEQIPFNRPYLAGSETDYIIEAVGSGWLSARGSFGGRCEEWLARETGCARAFLTHSCTTALEAAALICGIGEGDEVVLPSFTFVTTASAFALRGATPVFVDIEPETLNLDPAAVEAAITPRTKAIVPIHYAGIAAPMEALGPLAGDHGLVVIEDAAQGLMASWSGQALGAIGALGALSFHETKNVTSGEGGALLVNDPDLIERVELIWDKGTNRRRFERGEVERYTWVELGSSLGAGEVTAAFLFGQLEHAQEITVRRRRIWDAYHAAFEDAEQAGRLRRPRVPPDREHNAHMYYLLLADAGGRGDFIEALAKQGVMSVFHYVPLHSSPAGRRLGRIGGSLKRTEELSTRLVRLPLWAGMSEREVDRVIAATLAAL